MTEPLSASGSVRGGIVGNVQAVLVEQAFIETTLANAYAKVSALYTSGALPRSQYDAYGRLRAEIGAIQNSLYQQIRAPLDAVNLGDRIDRPFLSPALPPYASMPRYGVQPAGTRGLGDPEAVNLGVAPLIVWAAGVAFVLVQIALFIAIAYVIVRGIQIIADTRARIYMARQNTERYSRQVDAAQSRFNACLRAGGSPASCGEQFPVPEAPMEDTSPDLPIDPMIVGIGVGAAVLSLGVVAFIFYQFASPSRAGEWRSSMSSAPTNVSSTRGAPKRLTSGDLPRALRGRR